MKKLIAVLLIAVPMIGNAESIAYSMNKVGGKIVLTDEKCGEKDLFLAYSSGDASKSGTVLFGCWLLDKFAKQVIIQWQGDKNPNVYDFNDWVVNEEK